MSRVKEFRKRAEEVREILKNPFNPKGLEDKLLELLKIMQGMSREEIVGIKAEYEEIKKLLNRNIEIVAGGVKPFLRLENRGFISRRV